jgi:Pro-kumamolisin, activation domain/Fibronectin type III domain
MRRVTRSIFAFLLAVCSVLFSLLTTSLHAQQRETLKAEISAPADAKLLGRLPGSQRLRLTISLPLRNEEQLATLLRQLYDPSSPNYRHFLTVQQFTEGFGPSVADYEQVIGFAQSNGLTVVNTFPNRLVLSLSGSVASINQAFQVTMQTYQHPTENRTFYAPDVEPTVDSGLPVLSVDGLSTYNLPHPMLKRANPNESVHSNTTGSGPGGQFLGSDMRTAYGGGTALNGSGQAIGLIELGPYRLPDVLNYFSSLGQSLNVPIVNELLDVDGVCSGSPSNGGCDDGEEVIDIQQAISMAPDASALIVYEGYGSGSSALTAYTQAATDNVVKQMSISFGWSGTPGSEPGYEQVFQELAAQGQSSFVATGDAGANVGGVGYPGNSTYITGAGGTDLNTNGAGGAWQSETGWIGSGGGWNTESPIPTYQSPVINSSNGGDPSYRNIPDVSAEANTDNYFCANGSCQGGIGGTSLAAPRWAGFVALINQQAAANATAGGGNATLGFLNPTIYAVGQDASYANTFHDIVSGDNANGTACTLGTLGCLADGIQGFNAVSGFDLVTGWGSPDGPSIFDALFPVSTNANFSLSATPVVLNLTPGGGGTSSIAVSALHGFNAATNLTLTIPGAPQGVTATLSASSIPAGGAAVTLNVATTSATPGGTYVVVITGTSGGLTQTAYVTLALPAFVGLTSTPSAGVSVNQGGTTTGTITIYGINGFNGSVNLAASGLPSGVTASFSPTGATTSTVTFTATSTASLTGSAAPVAVTVTGSSTGFPSQTTTINVFVNPATTGGSGTPVDLSSAFNVYGFYADADEATITPANSLDEMGSVYSANLLNSSLDLDGARFTFGPANQPDAVANTSAAIPLPAGSFATLELLATGIEGAQSGQTVTVTYTDSTTSQFTQTFSDWCSYLNGGGCSSTGDNPGESVAVAMPYRDQATGPDNRVFYLYHYSFALNPSKTLQSLMLPANRDVVVLAATVVPIAPSYSLSAGAANPSTVTPGSSSTATVTLTPSGGYNGTVTLSCGISPIVSGANAPTCDFNPNPVTVAGSAPVTSTLTFTTVGVSGAAIHGSSRLRAAAIPERRLHFRAEVFYAFFAPISGLVLVGFGFRSRGLNRKHLFRLSVLCMLLACMVLLPSCGSGSSGGGSCSAAPSVPTGLAASSTTSSGTTLNWSASTAGGNCSATSYTIYQNGTSIATTTSTSYSVTGLSPTTQYSFTVSASNSFGSSAQSSAANVTTLSGGTPAGTYTISIIGVDSNGVTQSGPAATVAVTVN